MDCKIRGSKQDTVHPVGRRRRDEDEYDGEKKRRMKYVREKGLVPPARTDEEWRMYATKETSDGPDEPDGKAHIRRRWSPFHTRLGFKMVSA